MPNTSPFRFVGIKFQLMNAVKIKNLTPERQLQAIRTWWRLNLANDPQQRFVLRTDKEMQHFLQEAAAEIGIDTSTPFFERALAMQRAEGVREPWKDKVIDTKGEKVDVDTHELTQSNQILQALKKIVTDKGRDDHGNTKLVGAHPDCKHWRVGDERIFGNVKPNGEFTFIGVGRHKGKTNSEYKLDLVTGGKTTAETA